MSLTTKDAYINRISNWFSRNQPIYFRQAVAQSTAFGRSTMGSMVLPSITKVIPTLESGVTAYIPTYLTIVGLAGGSIATAGFIPGKMVLLGSLNIGTNVFTDGASMGTRTEGNTLVNVASPVYMRVSTALNATPGTFTVTYVDQSGNTAETTAAITPTASAAINTGGIVPLNGTDWGVRDITAAARSGGTSPSGVIEFYGIIPFGQEYCSTDIAVFNLMEEGLVTNRLTAGDTIGAIQLIAATSGIRTTIGNIHYVGDD